MLFREGINKSGFLVFMLIIAILVVAMLWQIGVSQ